MAASVEFGTLLGGRRRSQLSSVIGVGDAFDTALFTPPTRRENNLSYAGTLSASCPLYP